MTKTVPWHLMGVGASARETAREAARRDGKSLGEWLDRIITRHTARLEQVDDDIGGVGSSGRSAVTQAEGTADAGEVLRPRFIRARSEEETRVLHLRRKPGPRFAGPRPSNPPISQESAALALLGEAAAEMERRAAQTSRRAPPVDQRTAQLEARLANLAALLEDKPASPSALDGVRRKGRPDFAPNLGAAQHLRDSFGKRKASDTAIPGSSQHMQRQNVRRLAQDYVRGVPSNCAGGLDTVAKCNQQLGRASDVVAAALQTAEEIARAGDLFECGDALAERVSTKQHQSGSDDRTQAALRAVYEVLETMAERVSALEHRSVVGSAPWQAPSAPYPPARRR